MKLFNDKTPNSALKFIVNNLHKSLPYSIYVIII